MHFSSLLSAFIGGLYQLLLISFIDDSVYGFINSVLSISLIFGVFSSSSLSNFIFSKKNNYLQVIFFNTLISLLLSIVLFYLLFSSLSYKYLLIMISNFLITVIIEVAISYNIKKSDNVLFVSIMQLGSVFPRLLLLALLYFFNVKIDLSSLTIIYLLTFLTVIIIPVFYLKPSIQKTKSVLSIFKEFDFKRLTTSFKFGFSNLLMTGINQSPIIIASKISGGVLAGKISIAIYFLNLVYNVPSNIFRRYKLKNLHEQIENTQKLIKVYSLSEAIKYLICGFFIYFSALIFLKINFFKDTIDSFSPGVSIIFGVIILCIPFRFVNLYLGALLYNIKYVRVRIISQFITLLIAIILYVIFLLNSNLSLFYYSLFWAEALFTIILFISIKLLILHEITDKHT